MKQKTTRDPADLIVLDEWRAWDHLRRAIERRLDDPSEKNNEAVREASHAYVLTTGKPSRW